MDLATLAADSTALADPTAAALRSLAEHWPWLAVLMGMGSWLAKYVLIPMTNRHITFLDAMEGRERERLEHDVKTVASLSNISETLHDHGAQLKEITLTVQACPVARNMTAQQMRPAPQG